MADAAGGWVAGLGLEALEGLALSAGVMARAAGCRRAFPEIASVAATSALFDRVKLTRSTARYHEALTLARMLLEHRTPQLRRGASPVFAILFAGTFAERGHGCHTLHVELFDGSGWNPEGMVARVVAAWNVA